MMAHEYISAHFSGNDQSYVHGDRIDAQIKTKNVTKHNKVGENTQFSFKILTQSRCRFETSTLSRTRYCLGGTHLFS